MILHVALLMEQLVCAHIGHAMLRGSGPALQSQSESLTANPRRVCVCEAHQDGVKRQAERCHEGKATARGPEPPYITPTPPTGT
eukprot:365028-Chlamydomonas_euryale.AAC.9